VPSMRRSLDAFFRALNRRGRRTHLLQRRLTALMRRRLRPPSPPPPAPPPWRGRRRSPRRPSGFCRCSPPPPRTDPSAAPPPPRAARSTPPIRPKPIATRCSARRHAPQLSRWQDTLRTKRVAARICPHPCNLPYPTLRRTIGGPTYTPQSLTPAQESRRTPTSHDCTVRGERPTVGGKRIAVVRWELSRLTSSTATCCLARCCSVAR